jgi:hypothetical protein
MKTTIPSVHTFFRFQTSSFISTSNDYWATLLLTENIKLQQSYLQLLDLIQVELQIS